MHSDVRAFLDEVDASQTAHNAIFDVEDCWECNQYPADYPSHYCVGCNAYREHTAYG